MYELIGILRYKLRWEVGFNMLLVYKLSNVNKLVVGDFSEDY